MDNAIDPANRKIHKLKLMRNANSFSQLLMKYHAIGEASAMESITSFRKSFDNKETILETDAMQSP